MENSKVYVRDKRSPPPKHELISKVMSANKAKGTEPELMLRKLLWNKGLRGYRLNWKSVPGKPDIVFINKKVAIFVHGCFWHRCPICSKQLPKHNTEFWKNKFDKNVARDNFKTEQLELLGWKVLIVWECQLNNNPSQIVENIIAEIRLKT